MDTARSNHKLSQLHCWACSAPVLSAYTSCYTFFSPSTVLHSLRPVPQALVVLASPGSGVCLLLPCVLLPPRAGHLSARSTELLRQRPLMGGADRHGQGAGTAQGTHAVSVPLRQQVGCCCCYHFCWLRQHCALQQRETQRRASSRSPCLPPQLPQEQHCCRLQSAACLLPVGRRRRRLSLAPTSAAQTWRTAPPTRCP